MKLWCQRMLSGLLKCEVETEFLDYLLDIEIEKDLIEYLQDTMGPETGQTKAFMGEFLTAWKQLHAKIESVPIRTTRENVEFDPPLSHDQDTHQKVGGHGKRTLCIHFLLL